MMYPSSAAEMVATIENVDERPGIELSIEEAEKFETHRFELTSCGKNPVTFKHPGIGDRFYIVKDDIRNCPGPRAAGGPYRCSFNGLHVTGRPEELYKELKKLGISFRYIDGCDASTTHISLDAAFDVFEYMLGQFPSIAKLY